VRHRSFYGSAAMKKAVETEKSESTVYVYERIK